MTITLEQTANISFEVEIVRHFEVIPGEDSPLETSFCTLSDMYSSPIDMMRKYKVSQLLENPFVPTMMTPQSTIW